MNFWDVALMWRAHFPAAPPQEVTLLVLVSNEAKGRQPQGLAVGQYIGSNLSGLMVHKWCRLGGCVTVARGF